MPIWGNTASGWKNISNPFVNVSGTWKTVIDGWNNVAGVWKRCFGTALQLSLSSNQATGVFVGHVSHTLDTNSVTVDVLGGVGPYTYQWQYVSGDTVTCTTTNSADGIWQKTATPEQLFNAVWQCLVTDSVGNTGYSPTVQVGLYFYSDL